MSHPILFTGRLIVRRPAAEDLDGRAAFSADPATMAHLGGPVGRGVAWRHRVTMAGAWDVITARLDEVQAAAC